MVPARPPNARPAAAVSLIMNVSMASWRGAATALLDWLATLWAFTRYVCVRFIADRCPTAAAALSYTTLVALVPLTAIALAVLSAFPIFAEMRDQLLAQLFRSFVPEVGEEVEWWFRYFAGTSVRTTAIGVLALAVTVLLLLATVEDQLHHIWRVKSPRPWVQRILAYWALLTLGPLLLGASFSLPGYVDVFAQRAGLDPNTLFAEPWAHSLVHIVPFLLETLAFTLIYALIPNCSVRWREALAGALVAALMTELLKIGFALYIVSFSSYRAVYGALAAIPIFLLWMYVAWSVVLFGAEVAAALPQWRADEHADAATRASQRLGIGLALLAELLEQSRQGGTLALAELAARLGVSTATVDDQLTLLQQSGFVAAAADGSWVLARALDGATLIDLYRALQLPLAGTLRLMRAHPWQGRITGALQLIAEAEAAALSLPLGQLVGNPTPLVPAAARSRMTRPR
jgi:membrane protein